MQSSCAHREACAIVMLQLRAQEAKARHPVEGTLQTMCS